MTEHDYMVTTSKHKSNRANGSDQKIQEEEKALQDIRICKLSSQLIYMDRKFSEKIRCAIILFLYNFQYVGWEVEDYGFWVKKNKVDIFKRFIQK